MKLLDEYFIGLSESLEVSAGYDSIILDAESELTGENGSVTRADAIALADKMIERWQRFKSKVRGGGDVAAGSRYE
jgi:hypothetical protein